MWNSFVLSTELIMPIGHRGEFQIWRFERQLFFTAKRWRANARNVSFRKPVNTIKKTTLLCYTPHGHSNTVSLETYPLCSIRYWSHKRLRTRVTLLYVIHFTWNKEFDISYSFSVFMGRPFFVCTEVEFFFSTKGGKEPVVVWGNIFNGFWI